MKKWLVLFIFSLYLYMLFALLQFHAVFGWLAIILTLVSGCFNIANAVKMQRNPNDKTAISMKAIMILKLCLLPVYAAFLMLFIAAIGMTLSVWFTIIGIFMLPLVVIYSYFVLFASSSLAISRIIVLGRNSTLSIGQCIVYIILQLLFVLDVIGSIIVYQKEQSVKNK